MSPAGDMPLDKLLKGVKIHLPLLERGDERNAGTFELDHGISPLTAAITVTRPHVSGKNMPFSARFARIMGTAGAVCLLAAALLLCRTDAAFALKKPRHPPVQARRAANSDRGGDMAWQKTFSLVANPADPVAVKLLTWIYVTQTDLPVDAHQMMAFVSANPGWPMLHVFRDRIEAAFGPEGVPPQQVIDWCDAHPPASYDGIRAYMDALLHFGQTEKAKAALARFWQTGSLDRSQTATLYSSYRHEFAPGANAARLDALIWDGRYTEAEYMLAFVDDGTRALAKARIALARQHGHVDALVRAVPAALQKDEGLLYERLRWRRRHQQDDGALELLNEMPQNPAHPGKWWDEQNILSRRKLEDRDYKGAYDIITRHRLQPGGIDFAQAEWLTGWIALRQLHKPIVAYRHFDALYRNVGAAISRARAAYWAARAAEALPDGNLAAQWDKVGAQYLSTYYGQLSYERLYGKPSPKRIGETAADRAHWQAFQQSDLVRVVRLLVKMDMGKVTAPFFARLNADAKTRDDFKMVAALAREAGQLQYAVQANKDIQVKLGQFLFIDGYPVFSPLPAQAPEKALVHAIIHRESMFNPQAVSPVGARGMMQLMPATAKHIARSQGEQFNTARLTADPRFNIQLGSAYLRQLVNMYDGYYPLAIAAYNAGPNNVNDWLNTFGDPRKGDMDIVDWIEHIPNYETRNYVERVLETYYLYRLRFSEKPYTAVDFRTR
ncbi:MAG: transglycosylase SLT domain-containing protein [Alphaproteobacteria bacterium]|nr:transglycosylase SLT domain-containing protein [Alphaproteobacteria bacterium]